MPDYPHSPDALTNMFMKQRWLQETSYGYDFKNQSPADRLQYIKDMVLSATDELHEALKEANWKPWTTDKTFHRDAYVSEVMDAWLFLLNLMMPAFVSADEFHDSYLRAFNKSIERMSAGYAGTRGVDKCPRCSRSYDDEFVECDKGIEHAYAGENPDPIDSFYWYWCSEVESYVKDNGDPVDDRQ